MAVGKYGRSREVASRYCKEREQIYRHGKGHAGHPRFRCLSYKKSFQINDAYEAHKPGIKERIAEMSLNRSGVRDTVRVLKVGINTDIRT